MRRLAIRESPAHVKLSWAGAITLGFERGLFHRGAELGCLNLLLQHPEGCYANCHYCGQGRGATGTDGCNHLIRVEWPSYPLEEILKRTSTLRHKLRRVCVSMITHPKSVGSLSEVVARIREASTLPISTIVTPTLMARGDLRRLKEVGVERVTVALDAATEGLFQRLRGRGVGGPHLYSRYIRGIEEAAEVMGVGKVGCHLIVGLGETERKMAEAVQRVHDLGGVSHLFSFFPEPGTPLENHPRPSLSQYRRVQLARHFIDEGLGRAEDMTYDSRGRIVDYGLEEEAVEGVVLSGIPFQTSGCPGCNRPYANERPSEPLRNFPFPPTPRDIHAILAQMGRSKPTAPRFSSTLTCEAGIHL